MADIIPGVVPQCDQALLITEREGGIHGADSFLLGEQSDLQVGVSGFFGVREDTRSGVHGQRTAFAIQLPVLFLLGNTLHEAEDVGLCHILGQLHTTHVESVAIAQVVVATHGVVGDQLPDIVAIVDEYAGLAGDRGGFVRDQSMAAAGKSDAQVAVGGNLARRGGNALRNINRGEAGAAAVVRHSDCTGSGIDRQDGCAVGQTHVPAHGTRLIGAATQAEGRGRSFDVGRGKACAVPMQEAVARGIGQDEAVARPDESPTEFVAACVVSRLHGSAGGVGVQAGRPGCGKAEDPQTVVGNGCGGADENFGVADGRLLHGKIVARRGRVVFTDLRPTAKRLVQTDIHIAADTIQAPGIRLAQGGCVAVLDQSHQCSRCLGSRHRVAAAVIGKIASVDVAQDNFSPVHTVLGEFLFEAPQLGVTQVGGIDGHGGTLICGRRHIGIVVAEMDAIPALFVGIAQHKGHHNGEGRAPKFLAHTNGGVARAAHRAPAQRAGFVGQRQTLACVTHFAEVVTRLVVFFLVGLLREISGDFPEMDGSGYVIGDHEADKAAVCVHLLGQTVVVLVHQDEIIVRTAERPLHFVA